jgi:Family of unknown function (DUF6502)
MHPTGTTQSLTLQALNKLLRPIAQLAIANGVKLSDLEESLKTQLVSVADTQLKTTSAISLATGVHRKDVTRLLLEAQATQLPVEARTDHSPAIAAFTVWANDPQWRDPDGSPKVLVRQADPAHTDYANSFDALCKLITKELPTKTILNELERLGLVSLSKSEAGEKQVHLLASNFIPKDDKKQMLGLLADNVGDHLSATVNNILGQSKHLEQAIFSEPIDSSTALIVEGILREQWAVIKEKTIPTLMAAEAANVNKKNLAHRIRYGIYTYLSHPR